MSAIDPFLIEMRYMVVKCSDIDAAGITADEARALNQILAKVEAAREKRGAGRMDCVVVECDWPEYKPVIQMLKERCESLQHGSAKC